MATIREAAQAFEPQQTHNIAELEEVSVDIEIQTNKGKTRDGEEFEFYFTTIDGKDYRIPSSVLAGLKALLKKAPQMKAFSVLKEGTGMNTKYQVIPRGLV